MKLPDHIFAEDLASDQQQLLPIEIASSKQATGRQVEPAHCHIHNHVIKHTQLNLLQQAISQMHMLNTMEGMEYEEDPTFQKQLEEILLNPDYFVASNIRNHVPAWKLYFEHFEHTAQSKQVLT